MRLLLIEDDPHLSELVPKALRAKGFAVDICDLAAEACCALKDGIFDTVILDLGLPDQDGVRRHINWNNQRPDLKEDLAHLVQDIKRRICGVASAWFPSFSA